MGVDDIVVESEMEDMELTDAVRVDVISFERLSDDEGDGDAEDSFDTERDIVTDAVFEADMLFVSDAVAVCDLLIVPSLDLDLV